MGEEEIRGRDRDDETKKRKLKMTEYVCMYVCMYMYIHTNIYI